MRAVVQAANPLPFLLNEEKHGDRQATEAVFLTYNADLGFFETRILGACMSAGARVCVIADANVWNPDPYATRHAGRDYHVGLAAVPGAFHAKLAALVGPKRAVVAIGSGNLTMGGWQHNAETWTILRGDTVYAPSALAGVADTLSDIAALGLDPLATAALQRTAHDIHFLLDRSTEVADTGHRILSTTRGPLVDQLPGTGASEVWLYAPFHDTAARGTTAILKKLRPERVTVMIQPGLTVVAPAALECSLRESGAAWQVVRDATAPAEVTERYRHGKLVEWTDSEGGRYALTGSPNLSYAALATPEGIGNTEVAILSPLDETLFPTSASLDVADVPHVVIPAPEEVSRARALEAPRVSSAILAEEGLAVWLTRPLVTEAQLEASLRDETPDTWTQLSILPAGTTHTTVPLANPLPASSTVRLRPHSDAPAALRAIVFVTDAERVQRRITSGARSRTAQRKATDLWGTDLAIVSAFSADLAELAADVAATKPPPIHRDILREPGQGDSSMDTETSPWLWLKDQAAANHGAELAAFGLGMLVPPEGEVGQRLQWEDLLVGEDEVELVTDTAENVDADDTISDAGAAGGEAAAPDHTRDPEEVRKERRRRIVKWSDLINAVPLSSALIVLRLALVWWCAGDWDEDDTKMHRVIGDLASKIAERDNHGARPLAVRVASLVAVALTVLGDRVVVSAFTENTLNFSKARKNLSYLGLDVHEDLVAVYCRLLKAPSGMPLEPEHVMDNVHSWLTEDPLSEVVMALERAGYGVTRVGPRLVRVDGTFANPESVAIRAADLVPDEALPVGVWAVSNLGAWTFVSWSRPDLIRAVHRPTGATRWRHQRLPRHLGPLAASAPERHHGVIRHTPPNHEFEEATDALRRLGLSSAEPAS
jgi:hypothetical protein